MLRTIFAVLTAFFVLRTATAQDAASIAEIVPPLLEEYNVPGLAVAVIRDGEIALVRGFGSLRAGEKAPVGDRTVSRPRLSVNLSSLTGRICWCVKASSSSTGRSPTISKLPTSPTWTTRVSCASPHASRSRTRPGSKLAPKEVDGGSRAARDRVRSGESLPIFG